jgi:Cytochrome P450
VDELELIDDLRARHGTFFRRSPGVLYVGEPDAAKAVLANTGSRYLEHSDFFHTSKGILEPRSAQLEIGRAARNLLRDHWSRHRAEAARLIGSVTEWPDTGNLVLYQCFRQVLAPRPELAGLVDQVVRHAVMAGAREHRSLVARSVLRIRVRRALAGELATRRTRGVTNQKDLLDVLATSAPDAPLAQLAEVFLSCLFAITGSMGFLLGSSIYLRGTTPPAVVDPDVDPVAVVREALRLWPVAWNFGRRPAHAHHLGDVPVTTTDEVVVCGYLVHRDERHWPDPTAFRPDRWTGGIPSGGTSAFIPFGWGQHSCVAAALAVQVVADILRQLPERWQVEAHHHRPHVAAALAPPAFTLRTQGTRKRR